MSAELIARRRRFALRLIGGALAWSAGLLFTALLAPLYDGQTVSDASGLTLTTATYVQRNGAWTLIPLVLPAVTALAVAAAVARGGLPARRGASGAVIILTVVALVLVTGGGVLLLPVAIMLAGALNLTRIESRRRGSASPSRVETQP